jgi:UDP-2-acetamido-2-deoxy-ribo-hexuluronate aminotransferase
MIHYPKCLHQQPVFADLGYGEGSFPVAETAAQEVMSLPMHPWFVEGEQSLVIQATLQALMVELEKV